MEKEKIILRAHHGMCLSFFEGKGYSSEFTIHMQKIQDQMKENPELFIVAEADEVCSHCPNLKNGQCGSFHLVRSYDQKVLDLCGVKEKTDSTWKEFSKLVKEKILIPGKRHEICGGCEWTKLCDEKERKMSDLDAIV